MLSVQPPDPARTLLRALDRLPPREREDVLAWLLGGMRQAGPSGELPGTVANWLPAAVTAPAGAAGGLGRLFGGSARGEQQLLPVRLPVEQHAALREWCQQHGFTMATVLRGLVAQFLEAQAGRDAGPPSAREAEAAEAAERTGRRPRREAP